MDALLSPELGSCADIISNAAAGICLHFYGSGLFPVERLQSFMDFIHNLLPDLSGVGAAVDSRHGPGNIIANPDCSGVVTGIAAEPGILAAVGGSCFSGGRYSVFQSQSSSGAIAFSKCSL